MANRKKHAGFFIKFTIAILCIALVFVGGYFLLDKTIVPKYFGEYGIYNMSELVGMMKTLYTTPNESKLVTNGFTQLDTENAEDKLKDIFPTKENSTDLDYDAISNGQFKQEVELPITLEFSDKELAGVIDRMLELGLLAKKLPNLEYINTIAINILELTITPQALDDGFNPDKANIHAIFKFDTTDVREQMANEMGISLFLLNMIVPNTLYVTLDYTLEITNDGWEYSEGLIMVNGRTAEQSEILIDLLISFIFPEEDNMNAEKLTNEFGKILQSGLDLLGKAEYKENGIIVTVE